MLALRAPLGSLFARQIESVVTIAALSTSAADTLVGEQRINVYLAAAAVDDFYLSAGGVRLRTRLPG